MRACWRVLLIAVATGLLPALASAQAVIAGVVRDASGGVLPGVTVEAASPELIEKVRSVITDGAGQFRIIDLRPGAYTVTFTLPGFSTVKREGIQLSGSATATVNADMRVGALEETVTVTGEAPIVDVQSVQQQRVMNKEVIDAVPSGRYLLNLGVLVPGVTIGTGPGQSVANDVGGTLGETMATVAVHGSRGADNRMMIDGLSIADAMGAGGTTGVVPNMTGAQEVTIDTSAVSADQAGGGVRINVIPREGGNNFSGTIFANGTTSALQGSNLSDELRGRGFTAANGVDNIYDINPGLGGPILKDRIWFFGSARYNGNRNYIGGMFFDQNAGNPNAWTWNPDRSRQATSFNEYSSLMLRVTVQATDKHKFSIMRDSQARKYQRVGATTTPESANVTTHPLVGLSSLTWSSPMTNKILLEAGLQEVDQIWYNIPLEFDDPLRTQIGVLDQSNNVSYRGRLGAFSRRPQSQRVARASMSYVTGSHAIKFGFTNRWGWNRSEPTDNPYEMSFRFNNGIPNQLTQRAVTNTQFTDKLIADYAIYAQDRWTIKRMTLNYAVRYEGLITHTAPGYAGPSMFAPNRDLVFEERPWGNMKDITPRVGVSYDLFGNGKTAVKGTINKYISAATYSGFNPVTSLSTSITRPWNDANGNFSPDCNLLVLTSNGECGPASNLNFGGQVPVTFIDPETYTGWGRREFNWEMSASVQQAVSERVSVNVGYFRRWYGNFLVTDNRAVTAADHTAFSVTTPADSRLPGGGGQVIPGYYDLNPNKVGQVDNMNTFAKNYGKQTEHWNGVDATVDVRLRRGVLLQGGMSAGRASTNNCDIIDDVPEALFGLNTANVWTAASQCNQVQKLQTQFKGLGAYTLPRVNVQVAATFQSLPGPQVLANYVALNAAVQPSLGRPLSQGPNTQLQIVTPQSTYGERMNQVDLRFGRTFTIGNKKTMIAFDLYNALNANPVLSQNNAFASWQRPLAILDARFAKFTAQFDF